MSNREAVIRGPEQCVASVSRRRRDVIHRAAVGELFSMLIDRAASSGRPLFLRMTEAMEYSGLSRGFLTGLIDAGKLTAIIDASVLKVRRSDLDALAAAEDIAAWYTEDTKGEASAARPTPPRDPSGRFRLAATQE